MHIYALHRVAMIVSEKSEDHLETEISLTPTWPEPMYRLI